MSARAPFGSARLNIGFLDPNERWGQESRTQRARSWKPPDPHASDTQKPEKGNGVSVSRAQSSHALSCDPPGGFQRYLRTSPPDLLVFVDHAVNLVQCCSLSLDRHSASFCDELRSHIFSS